MPEPSVSGRAGQRRDLCDRGSSTAEFAVLLPALLVMLVLVLSVAQIGRAQIQCVDAARAGARQAARSEADGRVLAAVRAAAPRDAEVALSRGPHSVAVVVRARVAVPGRYGLTIQVASRAVADLEHQPWVAR